MNAMHDLGSSLIEAFREVRDIPYRIPLSPKEADECCTGKHKILMARFAALGISSRWRVCSFRWSDMALPETLLQIPHDEMCTHAYLEVELGEKWVRVDATWDAATRSVLPINDWDGVVDTPVAVPVIEVFSVEKSREIMQNENPEDMEKDLERVIRKSATVKGRLSTQSVTASVPTLLLSLHRKIVR